MVQVERLLFSVDDYYKMLDDGIIQPTERVELIKGEIIKMSPIKSAHAGMVNLLTELLMENVKGSYNVAVQNPLHLSFNSEPEPDLSILKFRRDRYSSRHPRPEDVYLLIEGADTTLQMDREIKKPLYAEANIKEYWIVNLQDHQIEVFKNPKNGEYLENTTINKGEKIVCTQINFTLDITEIFF